MKEYNTKIFKKEIEFESSEQKISISISLRDINKSNSVFDFLDSMFKEIKKDIFTYY